MSDERDGYEIFGVPQVEADWLGFGSEEPGTIEVPEVEVEESGEQTPVFEESVSDESTEENQEEVQEDEASGEEVVPSADEAPAPSEEQTVEELIFGKYKSLEEAEKGYKQIMDLQRRTAEKARQIEQEQEFAVSRAKEVEDVLRQLAPHIQQRENLIKAREAQLKWAIENLQGMGADLSGLQQVVPPQPQVSPQQVQAYVDQKTQSIREEIQAEEAAKRIVSDSEQALMSFYENHPEIDLYGELDNTLFQTAQEMNTSWNNLGYQGIDISDSTDLELLYEAAKDPALKSVLKMNPALSANEDGMQLARFQAALLKGTPITQQTKQVPASQVGQRKPVTESASIGTQVPPEKPVSEFEEALAHAQHERKRTGNPFFEAA